MLGVLGAFGLRGRAASCVIGGAGLIIVGRTVQATDRVEDDEADRCGAEDLRLDLIQHPQQPFMPGVEVVLIESIVEAE